MSDASPALLAAVAVRTLIVLVATVAGVRLFGRRQMGGLDVQDLLVVLLMANAVQNAMTQARGGLLVGVVSAGALIGATWLLGRLFAARPRLEERLMGAPVLLVRDGELLKRSFRREGITEAEVMAAIREYGLADPRDVRVAVLEMDGSITVVPRKERDEGESG